MNETDKDLLKWLSKLEDKFIALKLEMDSNKIMLKSISKNMKEMMAALNYLFDKIEIEEQYVVEDNMINSIEIEDLGTKTIFDIFKRKKGHYFIVDRKKEIYKNTRGQTISPQKIENLFQDFETIKAVFLIGDGKEFNTVLIYPNQKTILLILRICHQKRFEHISVR